MSKRPQLPRSDANLMAVVLAGMLALGGCSNLSGLGGDAKYACKAPEGVACDSVSGTYANALHNKLPGQRQQPASDASTTTSATPSSAIPRQTLLAATPAVAVTGTLTSTQDAHPLRSQARVLRLWTKPWEDMDGDLYDQGYVYVQISSGQWLIDHVQRQIRDAYAPLRPPPRAATDASGGDATQGSSSSAEQSAPARPVFGSGQFPALGTPAGTSFNRAQ